MSGELLTELLPIVGEINAVLDPDALLPTIARQLRRIIDYRILDIFLSMPDGRLVPALVEGAERRSPHRLAVQLGEGIVGTAALNRRPVFVPDVSRDPRYVAAFPDVVAELALPLVHRDRLVGVLNIEGPDPAVFTPDAVTTLQVLGSHLAIAIENATLYRETRWYAGLLATLYEIGKETASILDLDQLLQRVAEVVKRVIDYEIFGILLVDEEKQELVLKKAVRFGNISEKVRIKITEGLCGAAVRSKEAVRVGDVTQDPRYIGLVPETRSELIVPLIIKDRVVGVFDLASPALDRFTDEHVKMLTPLASQVAVAIENARLIEELRRRDARLNRELRIARQIQQGLLPERPPASAAFETSAHFLPARELGGDLYDFYDIEDGTLGLSLGDVAGKGLPAALYGAFVSGSVRARAFERRTPSDLLARANRTLRRRGVEGVFCTLTYALFDFKNRTVRIANSGVPFPLHFQAKTGRAVAVTIAGLPLGAFDRSTYDEVSLALEPGDVLVFHTDGVTEAYGNHEEYGVARLTAAVEQGASLSAAELGDSIVQDVRNFVGSREIADDVSLVVVKVR